MKSWQCCPNLAPKCWFRVDSSSVLCVLIRSKAIRGLRIRDPSANAQKIKTVVVVAGVRAFTHLVELKETAPEERA